MIDVQSLTRHYGSTTAVEDVSFCIGDHAIVGLLGHNGAGKTTVMRMLSGYLEPSAGSITIGGLDLARHAHSVQQQLGYLPENLPIYPEMIVADYLDYAATLKGIGARERSQAVREALAATDLAGRALDRIGTLSRGYRQRVGVAQATLGRPGLLILDEPTNGLDPNQTEHMRELIVQLSRRATIILSTHIMQEVDAICDRVLVLRHGRLALDESLHALHHTQTLCLHTAAGAENLLPHLRRVPQVAAVEQAPARQRAVFTLRLREGADTDAAADAIAQCVLRCGARLYQLQPVVRDLDSVFREVTAGGH